MKKLLIPIAVVMTLVLFSAPSNAGELFTEYYGLVAAMRNSGTALMGTVMAVNATKGTVQLLVKKIWSLPGRAPMVQQSKIKKDPDGREVETVSNVSVEIGKTLDLSVYQGVVWENENESPVDSRLFDHLNIKAVKVGQEVVFASKELLPVTPSLLDRLNRISQPGFETDYPSRVSDTVLESDLEDYDLSKKAFKELLIRKKAGLKTLITMKNPVIAEDLFGLLFQNEDPQAKVAIYSEARKSFQEISSYSTKVLFLRLLYNRIATETYGEFASLCSDILFFHPPLSNKNEEKDLKMTTTLYARNFLSRAHSESKNITLDYSVFELYWRLELQRLQENSNYYGDTTPRAFHEGSAEIKTKALMSGLQTFQKVALNQTHQLETATKTWLGGLYKMVLENPDSSLAQMIKTLPVLELKTMEDQRFVLQKMIQMAVALAKKEKTVIPILKPNVEKYLASNFTSLNSPEKNDTVAEIGTSMNLGGSLNFQEFDDYKKLFRK